MQPRLASLDVFRGATIAAMILVNNPGTWDAVYPPLQTRRLARVDLHRPDLSVLPLDRRRRDDLSFARRAEHGDSRGPLLLHALRRAAVSSPWACSSTSSPLRPGHGAHSRRAAAHRRLLPRRRRYLLYDAPARADRLGRRPAGGYWVLMKLVPVPGYGAGVLERTAISRSISIASLLSGHMWSRPRSGIPKASSAQCPPLRRCCSGPHRAAAALRADPAEKTAWMFAGRQRAALPGWSMNVWLPINKNLWTSSFALFMAGMAFNVFALSTG